MSEEVVFVRRASGLVRELTWFDVAIWALAVPAASGMTYYAVKVVGYPDIYGANIPLAFLLAGLFFLPIVIAFALITTSFPRANSLYVFTSRVLHPILGYIPFWYFVAAGCGIASGFLLFLSVKVLSGPLTVAAALTRSRELLNAASALADPNVQFYAALALIAILWAMNYLGIKVIKWTMRFITIIPLLITIIALVLLASAGVNGGLSKWDSLFGVGSSSKIMEAAFEAKHGVESALTPVDIFTGTYNMLLWTIWAWVGFETVAFVGSEVKDPSKSYLRGYIIGFLFIMALYLLNATIITWSFNYNFIAAYSYLKYEGYEGVLTEILGYPAPEASVPFLASVVAGNAVLAIVLGIAYFLWYVNTVVPSWVAAVRGFFSMAFDRALPEKLAEVSARWAAPTWANHLTALLAAFGALMTYMENMGSVFATALISFIDFSSLIFIWPVGLALMLIPWWRPELFKRMTFPSKVFASAVGAAVFGIGWFFMILTAYSDPLIVMINVTVGLIGLITFVAMSARNRARGIEPEKVYAQIPPA
ncbi:MAG: APC family permease [Desulfurococcaceae archaeon]